MYFSRGKYDTTLCEKLVPDFSQARSRFTTPSAMDRQATADERSAGRSRPTNHGACDAALEADRKVELLGNEVVNPLEQRVQDIEDLKLEQRTDTLFQRLKPYEEYKTKVDEQVEKLRRTEQALKTKRDEIELPVKADVKRHDAELKSIARDVDALERTVNKKKDALLAALSARVAQLEAKAKSSSADADDVALELLDRLQRGEHLHPTISRQIKRALSDSRDSDASPSRKASKRGSRSSKDASNGRKIAREQARQSNNGSMRKHSGRSRTSSLDSLSRTPSVDDSSAKNTGSRSGSGERASSRKMEVAETQQREDGDVEMNDHGAGSEMEDDPPPFIPGERKSGRTPKPRRFEDQIPWKVANKAMRGDR